LFKYLFGSFKEFFKNPYGFLLAIVLTIPVIFVSELAGALFEPLSSYVSYFGFLSFISVIRLNFVYLLEISIIYLIVLIIIALFYSILFNKVLNRVNGEQNKLLNGFGQIFGLFIFLSALMFVIFMLISLILTYLGSGVAITLYIILFILFIAIVPRFLFVPMYIFQKGDKIKNAFADSWNYTKDKYWSILLGIIIYGIIFNLVILLLVLFLPEILWLEILIMVLLNAIFVFWFISFVVYWYLDYR
jgi:hypothetical protein